MLIKLENFVRQGPTLCGISTRSRYSTAALSRSLIESGGTSCQNFQCRHRHTTTAARVFSRLVGYQSTRQLISPPQSRSISEEIALRGQSTPEIGDFLVRVDGLPSSPGISLDPVLRPSLDDERRLRTLFATDRRNSRLVNPHVGLVDVFDGPDSIRTTRARVVQGNEDLSAKYKERRKDGAPCMVSDIGEFKKNWSIFTEGSLSQLFDWSNVVAAGGSVLACLTPLDDADKTSKRTIRKFYHSKAYPSSDVDLFLWGLTPEQAEDKIKTICQAVRDSVPCDVTCVRTKHSVSIHSQYPYRSVQIILRLYKSPGEILAGFDIDAACCAYDGNRVWANPRAIVAMMRQCNTVDMTRRSPSYEVRLAKYSQRAFEVYVPTLKRDEIDPTIYERSIARVEGLARLLVLEKLADGNLRDVFLEGRRQLRGRPNALSRYHRGGRRIYKDDLKGPTMTGLEMSDYDVASLHIPYGPGWDARKIEKLVYQTDLGMNSTFNPKNNGRRLHRHVAFFGTVEECLEDCCEHCPKPVDHGDEELQQKNDEHYIRGRIKFVEDNPGRQSITGSFNPINVGEWSEQVYVKPTQKLFTAIAAHDRPALQKLLSEGIDVNQRDHVGRTTLHVAIFSRASEIACDLIDAGARISARLVDGRAPLHLAAQFDQTAVIQKLLEKNAKNIAAEAEKGDNLQNISILSVDQEASDNDSAITQGTILPEEFEDGQPDVINIDARDWDYGFSALAYAILFASIPTLEALLKAGVDITLATKPSTSEMSSIHPFTLTILREDQDEACKIAERLIKAGASSSTADDQMRTILHVAVYHGRTRLVETLLRCDPHARTVINSPALGTSHVFFPIVTAINKKHYGLVTLLLAHGAKLDLEEMDVTRTYEAASPDVKRRFSDFNDYLHLAYQPLETAVRNHDDLSKLLIALGAPADVGLVTSLWTHSTASERRTLREWIDYALGSLDCQLAEQELKERVLVDRPMNRSEIQEVGWKAFCKNHTISSINANNIKADEEREKEKKVVQETRERLEDIKSFLHEIKSLLANQDAKSWNDLYPTTKSEAVATSAIQHSETTKAPLQKKTESSYMYKFIAPGYFSDHNVPKYLQSAYDELYEACYSGDNDKVQRLCLPVDGEDPIVTSAFSPLNISVKIVDEESLAPSGFTPLYAAIAGRQWSTAKLIIAIATAQYHPADEDKKITFDTGVELVEDDCESDDDFEFDISKPQEVKFVDIATRSSTVRSEIHPKIMLQTYVGATCPLTKTVVDHDFEAFVNVANLYKSLPQALDLGTDVLEAIIKHDQPDILHEYIKRSGAGISVVASARRDPALKEVEAEFQGAVDKANRLYLGLNVHGKKRIDLARKNDPNAAQGSKSVELPLVWKAARVGAKGVLSYLSSERPLAAYKSYATSHSDPTAIWLKRMQDSQDGSGELEKRLAVWLGWTINSLGESPLAAAIISKDVEVVKLLADLKPELMKQALQTKIKFTGVNALVFAIRNLCDDKMMHYLLSRNVSPADRDLNKGWNIYHHICELNDAAVLEYFLNKLPRDVNEALLEQQSKKRLNTPLHVAVKQGNEVLVNTLLAYTSKSLLARDVDGQTPLHCAVTSAFPGIIQQLLLAGSGQGLQALVMENAIGNTPVDIAAQMDLTRRLELYAHDNQIYRCVPMTISPGKPASIEPARIEYGAVGKLEEELGTMREVVAGLNKGNTRLDREAVLKWIGEMEDRVREFKKRAGKPQKKERVELLPSWRRKRQPVPSTSYPRATRDVQGTFWSIQEALNGSFTSSSSSAPAVSQRQLIHLLDVQKSVGATLAKVTTGSSKSLPSQDDSEEEEEDRNVSMVFEYVDTGADVL